MNSTTQPQPPSIDEIKAVMEIAIDKELPDFSMAANWYEDYEMDSLGAVALSVEVRKRFGVTIPDERMPDIRTGEQLSDLIVELLIAESKTAAA